MKKGVPMEPDNDGTPEDETATAVTSRVVMNEMGGPPTQTVKRIR